MFRAAMSPTSGHFHSARQPSCLARVDSCSHSRERRHSHQAFDTMANASANEISPNDLQARHERGERNVLLDVREQNEWNLFRIPNAIHLPLAHVSVAASEALARFPEGEDVVYCGRGARSAQAVE